MAHIDWDWEWIWAIHSDIFDWIESINQDDRWYEDYMYHESKARASSLRMKNTSMLESSLQSQKEGGTRTQIINLR